MRAAGGHRFFGRATYGLHCKGVTASGVPLPELTQPVAVSLNGPLSKYGLPPSVTISATSWPTGAVSIGFQPNLSENMTHSPATAAVLRGRYDENENYDDRHRCQTKADESIFARGQVAFGHVPLPSDPVPQ
jgi:hypothetical protein